MENCFCGVNARRRSTAEQVQHLNERCSYPGALMILAGTIFSKRIVAPHTTQRIATTQPEHWKPMETLGRPSCQADAMRLRKRVALAGTLGPLVVVATVAPEARGLVARHGHCVVSEFLKRQKGAVGDDVAVGIAVGSGAR